MAAGTWRIGAAAVLCLWGPAAPRAAVQQAPERPVERLLRPPRAAGEFLVRFRPEATADQRDAVRGKLGARLERLLDVPAKDPRGPLQLLKLPAGADEAAALERLAADPAVLYAEPNYRVFKAAQTANDPQFGSQWGLHNTGQSGGTAGADIDAPGAWDLTTGSASVVVAVLDTGVDYAHPDLAANMWVNAQEQAGSAGVDDDGNGFVDDIHGWDFAGAGVNASDQDADPMDEEGHGTHVAGTIGAVGNNGTGVTGVAWSVKIVALRFLAPNGGFTSDAVAAYGYVLGLKSDGVNVVAVNNSWGGGGFSQSLFDAMQAAGNAGLLNVCAAGNSGVNVDDFPHYPSSYDLPSIVAVGASDRNDRAPLFSNFGANGVDLFAPGAAIVSTVPTAVVPAGYDTYDGTSMATPHVTGTAVLLASRFPGIGVPEMRARILYNVDRVDDLGGRAVTCGRLNARRALEPLADAVAPGAIADLAAPSGEASYSAVLLEWTAPGDDGPTGQSRAYEIRRSTSPITAGNFASAVRVPCPPLPATAGSLQSHRVCGLLSSTTYHFAMRTYDELGNASPISNTVSVATQAEAAATVVFQDDFEGGGGTFDAAKWGTVQGAWARRTDGGFKRASDSSSNYAASSDVSIITLPFSLANRKDATLSFGHRYEFEAGYDFGVVQVSTDGTTWRRLNHYSATKASFGPVGRLCLSAYDGFPAVRLRFRLLSDNIIHFDGWWLDDVRVLAQSTGGNQAPVADDKSVNTSEDSAVGVTLSGSDPDGDPITFSVVSLPAHGTLSGTGASRTYTPSSNYNGPDAFTYTANDGTADSAPATVSITVNAVNDAPSATPQSVTTAEDTGVGITLSGVDPEGDPLTFAVVNGPSNGTLTGTAPNLTYTPAADFSGSDPFTFRVNDGALNSVSATVSITVDPVNDAPTALPQSVVAPENTAVGITLTGSDPEGNPLTYVVAGGPAHGTLSGTAPSLTYTPAAGYTGADSFTFQVGDGALLSASATVSITVSAVNDAPTAANQGVTTAEDTPKLITLSGSDPDGNPLTYAVVASPAHGTLSGTPPNVTYTPAADYAGTDAFTFRTSDGALQSAEATVSITVTPVNDAPTGSPTAVVVDQGGSLLITLVASDPEGDPLTYAVTVPPANGTLTGTGPSYVYTPSPGFTGQDSLTFTVSDGTATGAPVVVTFTAPAPVAAGGGGGGGGGCGLLGVETLLLLLLARRRAAL